MLTFGVTVLPDPPHTRFVELMKLAEDNGFEYGWTYDSHILWQDAYPLMTLLAVNTERLKMGHCVTNPGTREPTVTASSYATLHDISNGRMVMGIGRGDSARRVIGYKPVKMAEFEAALAMMKDLMNGRPVEWNGKELELTWAQGRPEIPLYVAAYGPRAAPPPCAPWAPWGRPGGPLLWQWTGSAWVPGIPTPCDLSRGWAMPGGS